MSSHAGAYEHYSLCVPRVMEGDIELLDKLLTDHISGERELNNLRSRWAPCPLHPPNPLILPDWLLYQVHQWEHIAPHSSILWAHTCDREVDWFEH